VPSHGPTPPADRLQRALALHRAGRLDEAARLYARVLERSPGSADALHLLGALHLDARRPAEALPLLQRAASLAPSVSAFHATLGRALAALGRPADAVEAYSRALELRPGAAEVHAHAADAYAALRRWDPAVEHGRRAYQAFPGTAALPFAQILTAAGLAAHRAGALDDAEALYREAIAVRPAAFEGHNNLANLLKDRALAGAAPDGGLLDAAEAEYRAALACAPGEAELHHNLALLLLLRGRLREGFAEYEWRERTREFTKVDVPQPLWQGEPMAGGTLLVHGEQGLGDTLQFARYLPLAAERCRRVALACHKPLVALLARSFPGVEVMPAPGPVPLFERRTAVMSLARIAGTELDTIPARVPYLVPNPILRDEWRRRLAALPGLRVGIAWRGNPAYRRDAERSPQAAAVLPLLGTPGVTFVSLQKGAAVPGEEALRHAGLVDHTASLRDFDDTAALAACLDLVITSDTSVVHLAGALGVPTWAMVSAHPDWRWLLERDDSPWYPSMRLFRQPRQGDWGAVVSAVREALLARVAAQAG
jgi:tetratricopeptide (TPR) repeat protein